MRRATRAKSDQRHSPDNFYPRSPCGERRIGLVFLWWGVRFLSTLSLRRATMIPMQKCCVSIFLSTLSLRRATSSTESCSVCSSNFYPRSPCGERQYSRSGGQETSYFYPRSPCGERHDTSSLMQCQAKFLSTLSLRRATVRLLFSSLIAAISIHALLAESDKGNIGV